MKRLLALLAAMMLLPAAALAQDEPRTLLRMGGSFAFGVDAEGNIWAWGDNRVGQIGYERRNLIGEPVKGAQGLDGREILDIQCGNENALFLMRSGEVYACGANGHAQLGLADVGGSTAVPARIEDLQHIVQIDSGFGHSLALDSDGHVWAWGKNSTGQAGDGTRMTVKTPVMLPLENIVQIGCGGKYSMALDGNGTIWTWGENDYGQLGYKTREGWCVTPTALTIDSFTTVQIAAGGDTAYALDTEGHVWAWGRNEVYQCGNDTVGSTNYEPVRVMIPDEVHVARVIAYSSHTMALADNGDLWLWGNADTGQRGVGKKTLKSLPSLVMQDVADATAGSLACCLMKTDGSVWATGYNKYGQCGVHFAPSRKGILTEWTYNGLNLLESSWARPE